MQNDKLNELIDTDLKYLLERLHTIEKLIALCCNSSVGWDLDAEKVKITKKIRELLNECGEG